MLEATVIVIVELPEPGAAIVGGLKLAVVPAGSPETDKLIELLNRPLMVLLIVEVPWLPCAKFRDEGEADKLNVDTRAAAKGTICRQQKRAITADTGIQVWDFREL